MNYKSILASWFGLGILMLALQYPFQYIFALIGMAQIQSLAVAIAGLTASMIFTYYLYPHIMTPLFKIYAMLTSFCISMIIAVAYIFSNTELRSTLSQMLGNLFAQADLRTSVLTGSMIIFGLLIQFGLWYLFITLGNKQMVKVLEAKK